MADLVPILLEPHGPEDGGLVQWEKIADEGLTAGTPVQRGHNYFEDDTSQLSAGVWDCTPMTTVLEPYSVNEFMLVLEGSVTIVQADGVAETFGAGDCFVIPKGLPCSWQQTEYIRKFYVIFDDSSGATSPEPDSLRVIRVNLQDAMPSIGEQDVARYIGEVPEQHVSNVFEDPTGQLDVGLWDTTEMHTRAQPFARNELMHLLEGEVTLTNGDGVQHTFHAGQTFLVPRGMSYQWDSTGYVRKVYCIFQPGD